MPEFFGKRMKRITISLPDEMAFFLACEARRCHTSMSAITRQALTAYFGFSEDGPRRVPFAALGNSGQRHTARELENVLAVEWDPARERP